ncbi:hypothetical protein [Actinomadura sp. BRA 177]|uniref:hypothetical protein n=1 Tax=Actinomadura sp. BRA 177 TaxID=2745202 RepID=UPI0015960E50|nr:hypothetical protein [Actinomadura sp. BRA 177]NVI86133.1 hypothetical protein [Actinomadura sp. BRA 177]
MVDPEVPEKEREVLASHADALTPASLPEPAKTRLADRTAADLVGRVVGGALAGVFPLVMSINGWGHAALGAVLQAGIVAAWFGGLHLFLTVLVILQVLYAVLLVVRQPMDMSPRRLGRERHGRYYLADDFDEQALGYIERTRAAIAAIMDAEVGKAGLLDDVSNAVTLPRQEWEIARTCAELTRVTRQIERVRSEHAGLTEVLKPQRRALEIPAAAIERRVAALERYADRTKAADAEYLECVAIKEIKEIQADVRELLARTAQDDLAVAEIDRLSADTPLAELQRAVEAAKEAGLALTLGDKEPV